MPETSNVDEQPSKIQNVRETLRGFELESVKPLLDEKHDIDPTVGIVIVGLGGETMRQAGQKYHYHGAKILTSSPEHPNFVKPHFHKHGEEPYRILSGDGCEMNLGRVENEEVTWNEPIMVKPGDEIEVQEGEVHSLRNTGEEELIFIFACPNSHLEDFDSENHPNGDRYIVADLPNGLPPQYPKAA